MPEATFGLLKQILLDLGFTLRVVPGKYARFDHATTATWFVFPPFQDDEIVPLYHLVGVRRILDGRGVLDSNRFEESLRQGSIAG